MPELFSTAAKNDEELEPLARLEERVLQTAEQLRASRRARAEAQGAVAALQDQLSLSQQRVRELTAEVESLRAERQQIGDRLQKMLDQIDLLAEE